MRINVEDLKPGYVTSLGAIETVSMTQVYSEVSGLDEDLDVVVVTARVNEEDDPRPFIYKPGDQIQVFAGTGSFEVESVAARHRLHVDRMGNDNVYIQYTDTHSGLTYSAGIYDWRELREALNVL